MLIPFMMLGSAWTLMSKPLNDSEFWTFTATVKDDPGEPVKVGGDDGHVVLLEESMQTRPVLCA